MLAGLQRAIPMMLGFLATRARTLIAVRVYPKNLHQHLSNAHALQAHPARNCSFPACDAPLRGSRV